MTQTPKAGPSVRLLRNVCAILVGLTMLGGIGVAEAGSVVNVMIDWEQNVGAAAIPTTQAVVNPRFAKTYPAHDVIFGFLRSLHTDYTRLQLWCVYPQYVVAELRPPAGTETYWDFTRMDQMVRDFYSSTEGVRVFNFGTIPAWMFKNTSGDYPIDPDQEAWHYGFVGHDLKDPSGREVAEYFARVFSWYAAGGFQDELGVYHRSGHHYKIPIWQVLNEDEHSFSPEAYNRIFDATVEAIRKIDPSVEFMGPEVVTNSIDISYRFFRTFLDPGAHSDKRGPDWLASHFYAVAGKGFGPEDWQDTFFITADQFVAQVHTIERMREELSPGTKLDIDELGSILYPDKGDVDEMSGRTVGDVTPSAWRNTPIPRIYWNASAALWAYCFGKLSQEGVQVVSESQLVGFPGNFPSVSLLDPATSRFGTARYWVLKLIRDSLAPGEEMVASRSSSYRIYAQAFKGKLGEAVLLVNKTASKQTVLVPPELKSMKVVDEESGEGPARLVQITGRTVELGPFAVAIALAD